jgi:hypothetical protein
VPEVVWGDLRPGDDVTLGREIAARWQHRGHGFQRADLILEASAPPSG